jgi:hypothetical protein
MLLGSIVNYFTHKNFKLKEAQCGASTVSLLYNKFYVYWLVEYSEQRSID